MLTAIGSKAIFNIRTNRMPIAEAIENAEVEARRHNTTLTESDYKAFEKIKAMRNEVKTMKKAVRVVHSNGYRTIRCNIVAIEYNKGIKINKMRQTEKTPKASNSKDYKAITAGCKTTFEKYIAVINEANTTKELEKILGWIGIDSRLTDEEKSELAWEVQNDIYHTADWTDALMKETAKPAKKPAKKQTAKPAKKPAKKTAKTPTPKKTAKACNSKGSSKKQTAKKQTTTEKNTPLYILKRESDGNVVMFAVHSKEVHIMLKGELMAMKKSMARDMYRMFVKHGYKRVA